MSREQQVTAVAWRAFVQICLGYQLCHSDLVTVVNALVTLCLDYCNMLYLCFP